MSRSEPLSPSQETELRREAMLRDLCTEMRRLHRRRRRVRQTTSVAALTLFVWVAVRQLNPGAMTDHEDRSTLRQEQTRVVRIAQARRSDAARLASVIVQTDPSVLSRFRDRPRSRVVRLGDDELIEALAAIGRPSGLIYVGDEVRLSAGEADIEGSSDSSIPRG